MRIGLISDTHGRFDEALPRLFARCERIVHAGDVVGGDVLVLLEALAPVTAVRGNCDTGQLGVGLPDEAVLRVGELNLLALHDLGKPTKPKPSAREAIAKSGARLVAFGHSHQPGSWLVDGVLFVNPGSAGPRRFDLPRTAGILHVEGRSVRWEIYDLERERPTLWCEALAVEL